MEKVRANTPPSLQDLEVSLNHLRAQRLHAKTERKVEDHARICLEILQLRHRMSYQRRREKILKQKQQRMQIPEVRQARRAYEQREAFCVARRAKEKANYAADPAWAATKKEAAARRRASKPDVCRASVASWRAEHPEARARYHADNMQNPAYVLMCRLRRRTCHALAGIGKTARTELLLGCTWQELQAHIERQFLPGMSWSNRVDWHMDHKRPCVSFDLADAAQQRECFHYSNLQPLWKADNLSKGVKI